MSDSNWKRAFRIFVALTAVSSFLTCSEAPETCGNSTDVWFNKVVQTRECVDCVEYKFSTRVFLEDTFIVRDRPDYVLNRCEISEVHVQLDSVTLVLSPKVHASLLEFRETLKNSSMNAPVLIRLPNRKSPVTVMHAADLRPILTLFGIGSRAQIDRFVDALGADIAAVKRSNRRLSSAEPKERAAALEGKKLLDLMDEEVPLLEELQSALESGADDDTVQAIIDRLEKIPL